MIYEEPGISDYALIGNSCSAALVSKYGSIDWCCLPEFHSPSIFAALLDKQKGGYFSIAPIREYASSQRYMPDTNVVETSFATRDGTVKIIDAFVAIDEEAKKVTLFPDHEILRIVEGVSGAVSMKLDYSPRVFYGRDVPALKDRKKLGLHFGWKEHIFILLTTLDPDKIRIDHAEGRATAEFDIKQGLQIIFSLSYSDQSPAVLPELKETALTRMQQTIHYWQNWISKINYTGLYEKEVRRSVLALKLLAHAPSGSIIAAPTTSLPEMPGGKRNWDYRYCWLRDASFTIRVLVKLGFEDEARAYMNWILHATQLTRPKLQVVYSVYGHSRLMEKTIDWLSGYKNSKPVRIGNKAEGQFQLDIYGEVLDAVYAYAPLVKKFDRDSKRFIMGIGETICQLWREPDNGIWEVRSALVHHTHSKVMAWVGLDRLIKLCSKFEWNDAAVEKFRKTADAIRNEIELHGYNPALASYTREFDGSNIDASLLVLPLVDYCDPGSNRMVSTTQLIQERLSKNRLIYRYRDVDDGLTGGEGAFVVCNFWLVENLAKSKKIKEATTVFETVLKHASATGLLSEEIDTESHALLGNYPQGFSHIGLINAALSINEATNKQPAK
jgi:GH15 family glucan-1,4-alpha-glucosidase